MGLPSTILQDLPSDCRFIFPEEARNRERERVDRFLMLWDTFLLYCAKLTLKTGRKMEIFRTTN